MKVEQILAEKGAGGVQTMRPDATVAEAAALLSERRIGAVVISTQGDTADGILSERDIVRELGARGPDCMADKIADIMTPNPKTCETDLRSAEVLQIMTDGRFRHLPVMRDGKMIGLISIGDVVSARLKELARERDHLEDLIRGG